MFKNLTLYRIGAGVDLHAPAIEDALQQQAFAPCGPTQQGSAGWVPPRGHDHGALVERVGGQLILKLQIEVKPVPAQNVKRRVDEMAKQIEDQTGRKPGKKQKKELKEEALLALLPAAFPRRSTVPVWIDPATQLLAVGSQTSTRAEIVATMLVIAIPGLSVREVMTNMTPATGMGVWLTDEPPEAFSVDRACELKSTDEMKSTVRYGRHPVDTDEVRRHIQQGKVPTRLAMTFKGRVSFTLTDNLRMRSIELGDVVMESHRGGEEDHFDADVAIATGELAPAVQALIDALDGEMQPQEAPATAATVEDDALLDQAKALVIEHQRASISMIQRYLQIGYNRAARLLESLEAMGAVSPMNTSGQREVLAA